MEKPSPELQWTLQIRPLHKGFQLSLDSSNEAASLVADRVADVVNQALQSLLSE